MSGGEERLKCRGNTKPIETKKDTEKKREIPNYSKYRGNTKPLEREKLLGEKRIRNERKEKKRNRE